MIHLAILICVGVFGYYAVVLVVVGLLDRCGMISRKNR